MLLRRGRAAAGELQGMVKTPDTRRPRLIPPAPAPLHETSPSRQPGKRGLLYRARWALLTAWEAKRPQKADTRA